MADLTDLKGVGPSRAKRLEDAGYGTVEKIAEASVDDVRALGRISVAGAETIIDGARELTGVSAAIGSSDEASVGDCAVLPGDVIDRIAMEIVGDSKTRKRMIRAVSREIADRLAKPLRKRISYKGLKTKRVRKALLEVLDRELRNS
jgi:hypothetical protein